MVNFCIGLYGNGRFQKVPAIYFDPKEEKLTNSVKINLNIQINQYYNEYSTTLLWAYWALNNSLQYNSSGPRN